VAVASLAAAAAGHWDTSLIGRWADLHRRLIGRRWLVCRAAAEILRRPPLTRMAIDVLRFAPVVARPVVALLNMPTSFALPA
jgi:hypothetical protein